MFRPDYLSQNLQRKHFARFALGRHFERAATNLAIGGETLRRDAGVDHQFKGLTTERTLHRFGNLHGMSMGEVCAGMKHEVPRRPRRWPPP